MDEKRRVAEIYERLEQEYPDAGIALEYDDDFHLLVAVILSAQTTDVQVNKVTKDLFAKYPTAEDVASADPEEFQQDIRSTGFFRNKQKNVTGAARMILEEFDGRVPDTMEDLVRLPGVARKTANIVLGNAFGKIEGIAVDTHVHRLSKRLGLSDEKNTDKVERDLMSLFPRERWFELTYLLIEHGRAICDAKKPLCAECVLQDLCPSAFQV
jgi:endonuclease-3